MTLTIIASVLGLLGTWFAWRYNIKRRLNAELDAVSKRIGEAEGERDRALARKDMDKVTMATRELVVLWARKKSLEARLKGEN
jgi:hypothetical protein